MATHGTVVRARGSLRVPLGLLAMVVAAVLAGSVGLAALQNVGIEELTGTVTHSVPASWGAQVAHPGIRDRSGGEGIGMEVPEQRLYPDGFGTSPEHEPARTRSDVRRKW